MRARQPQRQFIGLAARVDEVADAQRLWQQPRQPFGITVHIVVQVARVGVEQRKLLLHGFDDARVTVPHQRHVVEDVEVRPPRIVIEILHPPAHDFQRTLVGDADVFSQQRAPLRKGLAKIRFFRRKAICRNSEQQIRVRR